MTRKAKYVEVREHLSERIAEMEVGDQLPTETTLCEEYGVSRITVRRAVEELLREGRVVREQGRGTFVTEPRYVQQIHERFSDQVTGFHKQQTDLDREVTTIVLQNRAVRLPAIAERMGLPAGEKLIELERLRFVNGELHQHVVTYMAASRFPGVLGEDFSNGSLFEYLHTEYGVSLTRNDLLVRLETVSGPIARKLQVPDDTPVLAIDSTVFDESEATVAFGVATHRPERSEVMFSLRSQAGSPAG